jgi:hypothetical protein
MIDMLVSEASEVAHMLVEDEDISARPWSDLVMVAQL